MALKRLHHHIRLKGDDEKHEQTDRWSNRDLIPLPPERRTWKSFNFYGFWAIASLNVANWQTPSTYLSKPRVLNDGTLLTKSSNGAICTSSYAHHNYEQDPDRSVFYACSVVRVKVAHWLHCAKQI